MSRQPRKLNTKTARTERLTRKRKVAETADFERPAPKPSKTVEVRPMTAAQEDYLVSLNTNCITFAVGPAGTGKTWLATAYVASLLQSGEIDTFYITRPAVEAGEELGFLPGELEEKYAPYLAPVRHILEKLLGAGTVEYMLKAKRIVPIPLAYMRGMTFENAVVLLDEAQNTSPAQMKMFLTRIGRNARLIIDGDPRQKDIGGESGLVDALHKLDGLTGVGLVEFSRADIVRHDICQAIVERYES